MWSAHSSARGTLRDAITEYRMLGFKDGFSFVEARPRTGRTHQIRVHFKALNHPVVADPLYAPQSEKRMLGFKRLALHSKSIEFNLPGGKRITVEAPYPADFKNAIKKLGMKEV